MDPNETAQKLLYQDPFHEVKRRRDKKKENTGFKGSVEPKVHADYPVQWAKTHTPVDRSHRMGSFARNQSPGIGREFRVVRDNRENQNVNRDLKPEVPHRSVLGHERVGTSFREKSSSGNQDNENHSNARTGEKFSSERINSSKVGDHGKVADTSDLYRRSTLEAGTTMTKSLLQVQKGVDLGSHSHSEILVISSSSSGVYASSSDPVHVPSPDSRSAGTVGAIRREVGVVGASQINMEWRPKSSQKSRIVDTGVIEAGPASSPTENSSNLEVADLSDRLSEANVFDSKHVIIPQHLRVPEAERAGLTFGSFGSGFDSGKGFQSYAAVEAPANEPSVSPGNTGNFTDIGLVQSQSASFDEPEQQQMQHPPSLPNFSEAYDPQHSYEMQFFGSGMEDSVHGQRLSSPPEALGQHIAISSPASTVAMVQHQAALAQQQPMLYPQLHLSHYPNFVPYRQILSPMYVPPMAIPNYSASPAYPHPSSGSSYLLMPGGNSHLAAAGGGMKYAASQYKPLPAGNPTTYANYTSPAGYALSATGTIGGGSGLDDVSRIKYKDSNLYVPGPQAEASEIWIQTQRDLPNMHSAAPFYNMSGQAPHAAYLPTPTGHASFNAAAQSSHVQFPGPHHLVHQQVVPPAVGGGVGVAAPGPQVGSYQQPQVSHLNWTGNF
ncbi:unnamed protein product [Spirodela intermedia]|uniref:GBF-interacting protein 1 N-terminal domain-containing protein n=1 Tax=Spirodela intermedia TaxID=51605 RepID=A0A7I8J4I2_SPIIN|nr:unnamed protein product [Spirodela intermedia]CAA6664685.1 unnamed protein product [Spirodela intermedia]